MVQPRSGNWVTDDAGLPRLGRLAHRSGFFSRRSPTSSHVNAEYAIVPSTSNDSLPQVSVTDQNDATFRGDWMQEARSLFTWAAETRRPMVAGELTQYSSDLAGNSMGRSWEAAGVRASIPFTHLYPTIRASYGTSTALNHKICLQRQLYVYAYTNRALYTISPSWTGSNTEAANQALRNIRPYQMLFNPNAVFGNHGLV